MKFNFVDIDRISPDEFEEFVMECFQKSGWKNLKKTNVGIDSRYGDGGYDIEGWKEDRKWLIEVKQRAEGSRVGVDSLRQIESVGQKFKIRNLILVTNRDFTSVVLDEAGRLGIELIDRNKLYSMYMENISDLGKRFKLRTYQEEIVSNFSKLHESNAQNKFLIEMATGLGKTVTSAAVVEKMLEYCKVENPKILFIVHQKEIVKQSRETYKSYFGFTKYRYSVLFDGDQLGDHDFIFATFQTILIQKTQIPKDYFDIVIVDEAHHFAANTFSIINSIFEPKFMMGLTATPERADGKDIYNYFGGESNVLGRLDLAWALKNKKLAMPKYLILSDDIDISKLESIKNGLSRAELDKTLFLGKKDEEIIKIIQEEISKSGITKPKCIVFCKSIKHINNFLNYLPPGSATFVHSKMERGAQNQAISDFREGSYKYILTVDIFNEGVDIPEVNALVFLRSTTSKTIWMQQLGRGLRKTDTKNYVHVFDFVGSVSRIKQVQDLERAIRASVKVSIKNEPQNEFEDNKESETIFDNSMDVNYTKSAAEIQKLIEQYEFKINTKNDCIVDINKIASDLGHIPTPQEIIDNFSIVTIDQFITLFDNYLSSIKEIFKTENLSEIENEINIEIESKILELLKINNCTPSAELVQISTFPSGLPLASIKEINIIIQNYLNNNDQINCLIESNILIKEIKTNSDKINSINESQDSLIMEFIDIINSREDLNLLSSADKNRIRKHFKLDSKFIQKIVMKKLKDKAA